MTNCKVSCDVFMHILCSLRGLDLNLPDGFVVLQLTDDHNVLTLKALICAACLSVRYLSRELRLQDMFRRPQESALKIVAFENNV